MHSNHKRSSNLLRSTKFWQPVTDVFLYTFLDPVSIPGLMVYTVTSSAVMTCITDSYKLKTVMTCITDAVTTGYEVIHFGVTAIVIGKYVNAYRRAAISPPVPGAQYKITA